MAARKKRTAGRRRGASPKGSKPVPSWIWLVAGILLGLGIAVMLLAKGYFPQPKQDKPIAGSQTPPAVSETPIADEVSPASQEPESPRYDFFTVLPEMEVVVPDQELSEQATPRNNGVQEDANQEYLLQVGSFQSASDAEQMKARLALLGIFANVQAVTVNDKTWHRVRVGPVEGARKADEMRRQLQDSGIDTLVMKNPAGNP